MEETGVKNVIPVTKDICSIEILPVNSHIKRGKYVAPHLHLSVAYILESDEGEKLHIKEDENSAVKWISIKDIKNHVNEEHMLKVYEKLINKSKQI